MHRLFPTTAEMSNRKINEKHASHTHKGRLALQEHCWKLLKTRPCMFNFWPSPCRVLSKSSLGLKPLRKSSMFTNKCKTRVSLKGMRFTFQISLCGTLLQDLTLCTNPPLLCDVTAAILHPAVRRFTSWQPEGCEKAFTKFGVWIWFEASYDIRTPGW